MLDEQQFFSITRDAGLEPGDLTLVVEADVAGDYDRLVRAAMLVFGGSPGLARAGVRLWDGRLRVVERSALYGLAAASSKGVGAAAGAVLPGLPHFDMTCFTCPRDACAQTRCRVGHRAGDPAPVCPLHGCAMEEAP